MPATKLDIILQAYDKMTAPINNAVSKAQAKLSSFAQKTDQLANKAYHSGKEMTVAGFAAAAPIVAVTKLAMDFEDAMADVAKVANMDKASQEFKQMGVEVLKTSEYLATSGENVAKLYSSLLAGSTTKGELSTVAKIAGEASVAFDMSQEAAGEAFMTMKNSLGISVEETKKAFDATNALTNNFGGKASQILDFMSNGGASVARTLKATAPEMEAFGRALMKQGVTASESGTVMERFRDGLYKNKEALAIFNKNDKGAKGMQAVFEAARRSGDPFNWFKNHKFGAYSSQMSLLALNGKQLGKMLEFVGDEQNYLNSANQEFASRTSTTSFKLNQAKIAFQNAAIKAGTALLPALTKLIKAITPLIEKFSKWVEKNPALVEKIAKTAAGFSVLALGAGYLSFVFSGVFRLLNYGAKTLNGVSGVVGYLTDKNKGLSHHIFVVRYRMLQFSDFVKGKMIPALKNFANVISTNVVKAIKSVGQTIGQVGKFLLKNPIILIIAAIALAAYLIYKYWGPIKAFFINLWNKIKGGVMPVINFLKNLFLNFTPIGWIIKFWKPISGLVAAIFRFVMAIIGLAFRIIKWIFLNFTPIGLIIKYWGPISTFLKKLWNGIVGFFKWVWDGIKSLFQKAVKVVYDYVVVPFNRLKDAVSKKFEPIVTFFRWAWEQIKAAFKKASDWIYDNTIGRLIKLKDALFNAGKNIIKSIGDGIRAGIKWLTDAVDSATQAIRDFFPFSPAKTGPLTDIHRVKLIETVAGGIDASSNNALAKKVRKSLVPVNAMIQPRSPNLALQGISPGGARGGDFNVTINLSGGATQNDAKKIGDIVALELKKHNDRMTRKSFA
jgi:TP901 family phage tail tape measure protein